ncbi:taste receptor type 2 member 39-like [Sturnira hondurensis]|uniref:taste receptor type 2 member 39-like n=1 Tax=Sturnira hondurensis TaxID=192404 RepID=UPI001879D77F|nr:taste receptor type 2 member 39-like [Sturnira hondurensis]
MTERCSPPEDGLSSLHTILLFTVVGIECIIGIIANGFIVAINAAEWIQNKVISTSGRILVSLGVSRLVLQVFMMLEITLHATAPRVYREDRVYNTFRVSFMFLNYCSLWFSVWLSFFYFVKTANFSCSLFLKLKWRITGLMPWLMCLSTFTSLGYSMLFSNGIYTIYCNSSVPVPSSNSTKKKFFTETNVINLALLYNLGIFIPLIMFILAATLLILSLKRHTLRMKSNATGSGDASLEAHMGAIRATSYFLILYIVNAVAVFLYMSNIFDDNSPWNSLCRTIMAAYPAGHSVLLILDNPGLRRAWKRLQSRVDLHLKK